MPYDDIRFSGLGDPDEDDEIDFTSEDYEDDGHFFGDAWIDTYEEDWEVMHEYECRTCGKETTYVDDKGDCSWCRMVNAG